MNHAAIDLGGKESQICIRQPDGTIIEERKVPTGKLTELVVTWAPSRVVMETSAEAFKIADAALAAGHQVRWCRGRWCDCSGWASGGSRTTGGTHSS